MARRSRQHGVRLKQQSGVAPMTVSLAINGNGYVNEKTRGKVMEAAKTLNYGRTDSREISSASALISPAFAQVRQPHNVPTSAIHSVASEVMIPGTFGYTFTAFANARSTIRRSRHASGQHTE
jgi:hypothetical protein